MAGYNDIEGTQVTFGESVARVAKTPQYEGAAIHLNTGGAPTGVNTNAGAMNLNVIGNLNPPVIQPRMVDSNTQTVGKAKPPIISPEVVQEGMNKLSQAVTSYTETMNNVRAKDAELALRDKLFKIYHGDKDNPGYSSSQGLQAVDGFEAYGEAIHKEMTDTLMGLSPAARLRARESIIELVEGYKAKGATHSHQEYRKIQEGQREAERAQIAKEIHAFPPDVLGQEVVGPDGQKTVMASKLKQRYFATYPPELFTQAQAGWEKEIVNAAERLYINKRVSVDPKTGAYKIGEGLSEAALFRNVIGKAELSEDALINLDMKLLQWEQHEISQSLESNRLAEARAEKNLKRAQNTREAQLFADLFDPNKPISKTPHEVWKMAAAQQISESGAAAYVAMATREAKGDHIVTDIAEFSKLKMDLLEHADNNFIAPNGENVFNSVLTSKSLNKSDAEQLVNYAVSLRKEGYANIASKAYKEIDAFVPASRDIFNKRTPHSAILEMDAIKLYDDLSAPRGNETRKEASERALKAVREHFGTAQNSVQYLPVLHGGVRPKSQAELNAWYKSLKVAKEKQTLSQDSLETNMKFAKEYEEFFAHIEDSTKQKAKVREQ